MLGDGPHADDRGKVVVRGLMGAVLRSKLRDILQPPRARRLALRFCGRPQTVRAVLICKTADFADDVVAKFKAKPISIDLGTGHASPLRVTAGSPPCCGAGMAQPRMYIKKVLRKDPRVLEVSLAKHAPVDAGLADIMAQFDSQWVLHEVGVAIILQDASGKYILDGLEVSTALSAWEPRSRCVT